MNIIEHNQNGLVYLAADGFEAAGGVAHGFSTRLGGVSQGQFSTMNFTFTRGDDPEHVIYNMVNGILLRPYISGMVWKLGDASMELMREGISLYKEIRGEVREGVPVFPRGFNDITDPVLAYGVKKGNTVYLAVFMVREQEGRIPLDLGGKVKEVSVIYPGAVGCEFRMEKDMLWVRMPQKVAARLFKIELEG